MISEPPSGLGFGRCEQEPCVYSKSTTDGSRCNFPLYVDDGRHYHDSTPAGRKMFESDKKALSARFSMKWGDVNPKEDYFLGANRYSPSPDVACIKAQTYVKKMLDQYCDGDISDSVKYPTSWSYTPASDELQKAYEEASVKREKAPAELTSRYGSLYGSLMHAVKYRPEVSAAMQLLGACLTFPTERLYRCLMHVLVYLGRSPGLGTWFTAHAPGGKKLTAFADANWGVTRSVTGFVIMLAGSAVAHACRRQHCSVRALRRFSMAGQ